MTPAKNVTFQNAKMRMQADCALLGERKGNLALVAAHMVRASGMNYSNAAQRAELALEAVNSFSDALADPDMPVSVKKELLRQGVALVKQPKLISAGKDLVPLVAVMLTRATQDDELAPDALKALEALTADKKLSPLLDEKILIGEEGVLMQADLQEGDLNYPVFQAKKRILDNWLSAHHHDVPTACTVMDAVRLMQENAKDTGQPSDAADDTAYAMQRFYNGLFDIVTRHEKLYERRAANERKP